MIKEDPPNFNYFYFYFILLYNTVLVLPYIETPQILREPKKTPRVKSVLYWVGQKAHSGFSTSYRKNSEPIFWSTQ